MKNNNKEYLSQFLDDDSVEELLKETGNSQYQDHYVVKFTKHYKLESGLVRVPSYIIYMHYRIHFTSVGRSDKIKPSAFFRTFKQMFTQRRSGNQRYYMLNTDFDLTEDEKQHYKKVYQQYYVKTR